MNGELIVAAIITALPPSAIAWLAYREAKHAHQAVNSRMTEMLEITKTSATAAATLAEKVAQTKREAK